MDAGKSRIRHVTQDAGSLLAHGDLVVAPLVPHAVRSGDDDDRRAFWRFYSVHFDRLSWRFGGLRSGGRRRRRSGERRAERHDANRRQNNRLHFLRSIHRATRPNGAGSPIFCTGAYGCACPAFNGAERKIVSVGTKWFLWELNGSDGNEMVSVGTNWWKALLQCLFAALSAAKLRRFC